ncbi:MAG: DUF2924 domain-containing protein [Pseudorhodoplanes sp.]|jgi:hypothetical protein|nr:DUF2924 domain-containing protein [Pseudorhodoplanes sp.]
MQENVDQEIEAEVNRLRSMPKAELRVRYRTLFKAEPPKAFGPDLLRRSIAYKIQEQAYGGLDADTRRLLNNLMAQQARSKDGRIVIPRRIKPGAVLVRDWKGKSHRVMVLEDGFAYEGKPYASLSEIARAITGARWNGPRFFGLRANSREVSA